MRLEDCFELGLLKKILPDTEKAKRSLESAKRRLSVAEKAFNSKIYEDAIVDAYTAMFHAGRALLFKDGIKERSHYGLYVYLKEVYKEKLEPRFINELNTLRLERHEILYGLEEIEVKESEALETISTAKDFINAVEKLLKRRSN
jgi:uncharacterized protein (UPF0332 family)